MMRLAMTREDEGGREVPVAIRVMGSEVEEESVVRLKNRVGTEPHVKGAMNVATAERPGWRYLSNLWTSLGVFPAWENNGLMTKRRGPHCMMSSSLDRIGLG